MIVIDEIFADSIESGDQIIVDGDLIEVREVLETDDVDEVMVKGYSHESGDVETYSLYADDRFEVWAV